MSLAADPPACTVPAAGGVSTHQLADSGTEKLVFKVKSSNNNEYKVKPVFGFVDPGASVALDPQIPVLLELPKKISWLFNSGLLRPMLLMPPRPSMQLLPLQPGQSQFHFPQLRR